VDTQREVIAILGRVLGLGARTSDLSSQTALLGSIPELDSMADANVITTIEEHFGFSVADDEIDGSAFATVGSLVDFVDAKRA
jgi:acyl carrier protein